MFMTGLAWVRLYRRYRHAMQGQPRPMTATTILQRRGLARARWVSLEDDRGERVQFRSTNRRWPLLPQPSPVTVFGDTRRGSAIIAVDAERQVANAGLATQTVPRPG
jgi:hypothetical protein